MYQPMEPYRALVMAGGGNRCWWQGGFWDVAAPALELKPLVFAGVSAGACMAAGCLAGTNGKALAYMRRVTAANHANVHWRSFLRGGALFPHYGIYATALANILGPSELARIQAGPEFRVLMASPPAWAGRHLGTLLGFTCYTLEKHLKEPLHPTWAERAGFRPVVGVANRCRTPAELCELILASSSTPPLVPAFFRDGQVVLDGGLIDNVPMAALRPGEGPVLVLLSRRYRPELLAGHAGVTYLMPSGPMPVGKWDYTSPDGLQAAYDLGRSDAERFLAGGPAALQR